MTVNLIARISKDVKVKGCARCHQDHTITFYKFYPSIPDTYNNSWGWLGFCENADAPVVYREDPIEVQEMD